AKCGGLPLYKWNGQIAGNDIGTAQFRNRHRYIAFNLDHPHIATLEINRTKGSEEGFLPGKPLRGVGIAHPAYDLVAISRMKARSRDEDDVSAACKVRLLGRGPAAHNIVRL